MEFPYGRAAFWILAVALVSSIAVFGGSRSGTDEAPDLVFALFSKNHRDAYIPAIEQFEQERGVKVLMQLVDNRALYNRLQSAMLAGSEVPDVVEVLTGRMGFFTSGPLEDVGFVDLTERIHDEGWDEKLVDTRFSLWSSRGHIFAIPHDVHPVMLAYRRDLVEELGIHPEELNTWDEFMEVGRDITADTDGDGVLDRYMLELRATGGDVLALLIDQRGGGLFNAEGQVTMDSEIVADTIVWYVEQTKGERPSAAPMGDGQPFSQGMIDGLALFYFAPDWRTRQFQRDIPSLSGKMALTPLPAWEPGGRRVSTWGGTGMAITKACKNQDLAWEFAKFLYFDAPELGKRFQNMNIIPPLKDAWDLPEFQEERPYYSDQKIGALYAALAPDTPPNYVTAYTELAKRKLDEAFADAVIYHGEHGTEGLREYVLKDLERVADYVRRVMERNAFLKTDPTASR